MSSSNDNNSTEQSTGVADGSSINVGVSKKKDYHYHSRKSNSTSTHTAQKNNFYKGNNNKGKAFFIKKKKHVTDENVDDEGNNEMETVVTRSDHVVLQRLVFISGIPRESNMDDLLEALENEVNADGKYEKNCFYAFIRFPYDYHEKLPSGVSPSRGKAYVLLHFKSDADKLIEKYAHGGFVMKSKPGKYDDSSLVIRQAHIEWAMGKDFQKKDHLKINPSMIYDGTAEKPLLFKGIALNDDLFDNVGTASSSMVDVEGKNNEKNATTNDDTESCLPKFGRSDFFAFFKREIEEMVEIACLPSFKVISEVVKIKGKDRLFVHVVTNGDDISAGVMRLFLHNMTIGGCGCVAKVYHIASNYQSDIVESWRNQKSNI